MASYKIDYRIGTDFLDPLWAGGDFTEVVHRGLPLPDRWVFTPYSVSKVRGDGRSIGDGNPTASWIWELLSQQQLNNLLAFFANDADASVELNIRTPVERGVGRVDTGDYTAVMHRPIMGESKNMIPESTSPVWEEVTLRFTKLTPR